MKKPSKMLVQYRRATGIEKLSIAADYWPEPENDFEREVFAAFFKIQELCVRLLNNGKVLETDEQTLWFVLELFSRPINKSSREKKRETLALLEKYHNHQPKPDPLRLEIANLALFGETQSMTLREIMERLAERGIAVGERQLRRVLVEAGIDYHKVPLGEKPAPKIEVLENYRFDPDKDCFVPIPPENPAKPRRHKRKDN